jgi:hypothetical protein
MAATSLIAKGRGFRVTACHRRDTLIPAGHFASQAKQLRIGSPRWPKLYVISVSADQDGVVKRCRVLSWLILRVRAKPVAVFTQPAVSKGKNDFH